MKKKFSFSKNLDISTRHINFNRIKNYSFRDKIRDLYDFILRRPIYKIFYNNFFKQQNYKIDCVLPGKGFSALARRKKLNSIKKIKGKKILNLGCGNAFDYHLWFRFKPESITGIDILNYSNSWKKVKNFVKKNNISTKINFYRSDILNFKTSEKFDFIVSDACFEHCKNFSRVVKICKKLLKKNGIMYASYGGPMWYTYGGDHFSGRDNEISGYNHLLLNNKDYLKYFEKNVGSFKYELNEGGGGGILVENKLFSKLSGNQYMEILKKKRFISMITYVEFCPIAYKLLKKNILLKKKLIEKKLPVNLEDFYLKTHIVYLKKK